MKDKAGFYDDIFNKNDDILAEKILMSWKLLKYIERHKKEYNKKYKVAENLPETERNEIYKYDFLLHSEYFILNIFKDFLKHAGFDINAKKDDLLTMISKVDNNDNEMQKGYEVISSSVVEGGHDFPVFNPTKYIGVRTAIPSRHCV